MGLVRRLVYLLSMFILSVGSLFASALVIIIGLDLRDWWLLALGGSGAFLYFVGHPASKVIAWGHEIDWKS
ncbi:MAG: hypothetical protein ACRC2Y_04920 [Aeromonas veronii]